MFYSFDEELKADYRKENVMLYNKDCLEVLEKLPNNSIDLVVTDCPYRVISGGNGSKNSQKLCSGILNKNNEDVRKGKLFKYNDIKFSEWLPLVYDKLKDNTHCYIFINRSQSCWTSNRSWKSTGSSTSNYWYGIKGMPLQTDIIWILLNSCLCYVKAVQRTL